MTQPAVQLTPIDPDAEWRQTIYYRLAATRTAMDLSASTVTAKIYQDSTLLFTKTGTKDTAETIPVPFGAPSQGTGTPVRFTLTQAEIATASANLSGRWEIKIKRTEGGLEVGPDLIGYMNTRAASPT